MPTDAEKIRARQQEFEAVLLKYGFREHLTFERGVTLYTHVNYSIRLRAMRPSGVFSWYCHPNSYGEGPCTVDQNFATPCGLENTLKGLGLG